MNYLRIANKGELDARLISLMGGTTKADDATKTGQFGTGLKYAIAYLIRTETKFRLFIGTEEIEFTTQEQVVGDTTFTEIYCNGASMQITTRYGYQWNAWEAIREIYCNSVDEGEESRKVIKASGHITGKENTTTFYIQVTESIKEVVDGWDNYFITADPLFENEDVTIYPNTGETLKLYKNKVLTHTSPHYKSLFLYDFKKSELNELRQYMGFMQSDVCKAIMNSNKSVVGLVLDAIAKASELYEATVDWSYIFTDKKKVKEIFQGYLFIHPQSDIESKGKTVKVSESLFKILQDAGLPCEKVRRASGYCFGGGGSGYAIDAKVTYKEVFNHELTTRIRNILDKYNSNATFSIGIPKKNEFEILIENRKIIFNSAIDRLPDAELESVVLIAVFNNQDGDIYRAFRRLIKLVIKNKYFRKVLFGETTKKPIKKVVKAVEPDDDDLPF